MLMRYHFGLAVGHKYACGRTSDSLGTVSESPEEEKIQDSDSIVMGHPETAGTHTTDSDSEELGSGSSVDYEVDYWGYNDDRSDDNDNEEAAEHSEMYGI
jgi:hypothetical protein